MLLRFEQGYHVSWLAKIRPFTVISIELLTVADEILQPCKVIFVNAIKIVFTSTKTNKSCTEKLYGNIKVTLVQGLLMNCWIFSERDSQLPFEIMGQNVSL